jgi:hypothetical protein
MKGFSLHVRCRVGLAGLLLVLTFPVVSLAQTQQPTLVELARREQERRKGIKVVAKVYTDKDVRQAPPRPATAEAVPPAATAIQEPAAPAAAEGHDEKWWKDRITEAREDVRRNEVFADALQTKINSLTTDYVAQGDPFQRLKTGEARQKALAEIERVKRDTEKGKKQITDIEDEARRAGVPPGWLR